MKKKIDGKQYDNPPYSIDERLAIYEEYNNDREDTPLEQFVEVCKLQARWDKTHAKTFEKLIKRPFNSDDFEKWYDKALPLWKKLQVALGNRVCKAYGCMGIIPKTANPRQEYCREKGTVESKCRQRVRNRKRDKKKKATANINSYGKKFIEQKGGYYLPEDITEDEFNSAINVIRDFKSRR